jgi:hypothetical protein
MPKEGLPQTAPGAGDAHLRHAALIARQPLNVRSMLTPRGGACSAVQVSRVLMRTQVA